MKDEGHRSGRRAQAWLAAAVAAWGAACTGVLIRAGLHPNRPNSLTTYLGGGTAWLRGQPLYLDWRGFVYSPLVAWFFGLFTHLPLGLANILWRLLTAGGFLAGLAMLLRRGPFERLPRRFHGPVFLGVLPLALGNLDNGQANLLVSGLMMLSVSAAFTGGWTLCAVTIAVAAFVKIYPLTLGLLLCLMAPRQLPWRLALALIVLGFLPFALQRPDYVAGQYHAWWLTRINDHRFHYPLKDAPLDLWFLLVRWGGLPLSESLYTAGQGLAGICIAAWVWFQRRRGVLERREILAGLFLFVTVWMVLLGPATENQTYMILAPAACLFCAVAIASRLPAAVRILAGACCALLLAGVARNSLAPQLKSPAWMTLQPFGALCLAAALLLAATRKRAAMGTNRFS